jgi:hypothetical protein
MRFDRAFAPVAPSKGNALDNAMIAGIEGFFSDPLVIAQALSESALSGPAFVLSLSALS